MAAFLWCEKHSKKTRAKSEIQNVIDFILKMQMICIIAKV